MPYLADSSRDSAAIRRPSIESSIEDLDNNLNRLVSLVERLEHCGDRLHGPAPKEIPSSKDNSVREAPPPLVAALQYRRDRLTGLLDIFERELSRVEIGLV